MLTEYGASNKFKVSDMYESKSFVSIFLGIKIHFRETDKSYNLFVFYKFPFLIIISHHVSKLVSPTQFSFIQITKTDYTSLLAPFNFGILICDTCEQMGKQRWSSRNWQMDNDFNLNGG